MITGAVLTIIGGLCFLGFYSWHVSTVDCEYDDHIYNKSSSWEKDPDLCTRLFYIHESADINYVGLYKLYSFFLLKQVTGDWHQTSYSSF